MLTTAWYSSFLSAFNSACILGYCSVWRMMSEMFCARRTSALGSPILAVSGSAASKKTEDILKSLARPGHEGVSFSPCPLLKRCAEESCQGPGSSWDLLLPWTYPPEVVTAPPITCDSIFSPVLGWNLTKSCRNSSGLGNWARKCSGQKDLDQTGKNAFFSQHLETQSIWKFHLFVYVCLCVRYKLKVLTFIQASFASIWILTNSKAVSSLCWLEREAAMTHWSSHGDFTHLP